MKIKEFICDSDKMVAKDCFSKNIEQYMKIALEKGNTIYFYAIDPIEQFSFMDKMSWIKDVDHEEYDMITIHCSNGRKLCHHSKLLSDMVVKLDLTDKEVKKVFDDKFKIGTTWATWARDGDMLGKGDPLFDRDAGYELRNFVVTKDDEVIMDASLHGGFDIGLSKDIVDEVDKEEKKKKWQRILFPFRH